MLLQWLPVGIFKGKPQVYTIGGEVLFKHQTLNVGDPQFHQCQLAERTTASELAALYQQALGGLLQALVGSAAVCPGQPAGAKLNATVPADDQYYYLIAILCLDG